MQNSKEILYGKEAKIKLKEGVDALANAVSTTLGPKGSNVALDRPVIAPQVVHDGVTVAREIILKDKFANMGAKIVKEAASKTNDVAGDGTTTSTVLAQAIVEAGLKALDEGANSMVLRAGFNKALEVVNSYIPSLSKPIETREQKVQIATISAQNADIGELIAMAMEKVGDDGIITIDESQGLSIELQHKTGMRFGKGYASAYFVTDPDKMEAVVEDARILVTTARLKNIDELVQPLNNILKETKNLIFLADDVEGNVLSTFVLNKLNGKANILAVKAPEFGERKKAMLQDIAILTGATLISEDTGRKLESITNADFGRVSRVISSKDETIIESYGGNEQAIADRVAYIENEIKNTEDSYTKERLKERLSKLTKGVAIINVGAASETELLEMKLRVEDAINATKAAVQEGIVAGGGIAYYRLAQRLIEYRNSAKLKGDEERAFNILISALAKPVHLIATNSGYDDEKIVMNIDVHTEDNLNYGFDVMSEQYGDLIEAGVVDPTKVVRSAIQNSISVAIMVLTTNCLVTDSEPEKVVQE